MAALDEVWQALMATRSFEAECRRRKEAGLLALFMGEDEAYYRGKADGLLLAHAVMRSQEANDAGDGDGSVQLDHQPS